MALQVTNIINCCTAKLIYGFGGSGTAGIDNLQAKEVTARQLKEYMDMCTRDGNGILTAYVTTHQTQAIEILESMGWTMSAESEKGRHTESKLRCYNYTCRDDVEVKQVTNPFARTAAVKPVVSTQDTLTNLFECFGQRFNAARAKAILQSVVPGVTFSIGLKYLDEYQELPKGKWIAVRGHRLHPSQINGLSHALITVSQVQNARRDVLSRKLRLQNIDYYPHATGVNTVFVYIRP